jgi:hypothetical protein
MPRTPVLNINKINMVEFKHTRWRWDPLCLNGYLLRKDFMSQQIWFLLGRSMLELIISILTGTYILKLSTHFCTLEYMTHFIPENASWYVSILLSKRTAGSFPLTTNSIKSGWVLLQWRKHSNCHYFMTV